MTLLDKHFRSMHFDMFYWTHYKTVFKPEEWFVPVLFEICLKEN